MLTATMKAIVCDRYGPPEQLQLREVPKPVPEKNEVLVKIHATAINDYDWGMIRGQPYLYRLLFGLTKPKNPIPGMELAGTIEAVGADVTAFEIGDTVYGDISEKGSGTFAEYVCVDAKTFVRKPKSMSFEQAAAIPHAAMLAVQGLIDVGDLKKGQQVLINGAGGGVGTIGLQIAKLHDAEVTGVDTGDKLEMMESLGFDHIIDYKKEDFTQNGRRYDLVLDAKTNHPLSAYLRSLKPQGKYVTVGGKLGRLLQLLLLKPLIAVLYKKSVHLVALRPNKDLAYINTLFENGKIKPVVDGPYPLKEVPRLIRYFGEGKHTGKIIVVPFGIAK
ncbi:MAG TPA: NAD(P)-dependent alcohol dehydrogenase [Pricia sp.]|nr:NAD(P)-dependent alcohol dehydrogenase [Pricia sp.]